MRTMLLHHRVPMLFVLVLLSTLLACTLSDGAPAQSGEPTVGEADAVPSTCRLRVVDRDGTAVADAEVELAEDAPDEGRKPAATPVRRRSDHDGFVDLRGLPAARLHATARSGARFGTKTFRTDDWATPQPELRIDNDLEVRLRIVDDRGEPQADLRVVVEALTLPPDEAGSWREVAACESNDDGVAVVPHAQTFGCWPIEGRRRLRARVDLLGVDPPAVEFALEDLGTEPFVLMCPANGRIVVRTWRRTAEPSALPTSLPLFARGDGEFFERVVPIARRRPDVVLAAPLACGWHLRTERHTWLYFRGPTTAGEVVTVDLVEKATTWFTLSLRSPDDSPLVGHRLADPRHPDDWRVDEASDTQGRLRRPSLVADDVEHTYLVVDTTNRAIGTVDVRLPADHAASTIDVELGRVSVQPFPLWLKGVVLDAVTQQPLAATVTCLVDSLSLPDVQTDAQGRFTLHAPLHTDHRMVFAHAPDHAAGTVAETLVRTGAPRNERTVLLQPARYGAVRLVVLHDPDVTPADWTVNGSRAQPASLLWPRVSHAGREVGDYELESREPGRTTFLARHLLVGRRDVELHSFPGGPSLAALHNLEVGANRLSEDPRLVLDLRGKVADARCRIEGKPGEKHTGTALLKPDANGPWVEIPFDGVLRATLPIDAAVPMLVVSDEGLPVRATLRPGTSTVAVPPLPHCTVQVRGLPDEVPPGRLRLAPFLLARNEPLLAELRNHFGSMMYLAHEEKPTARLRLPSDESSAEVCNRLALTKGITKTTLPWRGRYAFVLQVRDDDGAWNSLYERTPEHVDITTGGEQTIELTVDPEQVRALLRPKRTGKGQ